MCQRSFSIHEDTGLVSGFRREATPVGKRRIDFRIDLVGGTVRWLELKHWHIGDRAGRWWTARNSLDHALGDLAKLGDPRPLPGERLILFLLTRSPEPTDWLAMVGKVGAVVEPAARVEALTHPCATPADFFLGLVRIAPGPSPGGREPPGG
jgi:hypothetical protein